MPLAADPEYLLALEPLLPTLANAPKLAAGDVQSRREALHSIVGGIVAGIDEATDVDEQVFQVESRDGHMVDVHHYSKKEISTSDKSPAIYYLHGGGFICMDVSLYKSRLKNMCSATGVQIFAVEYRISPEAPYPLALEDAWAGLIHLSTKSLRFGIDPARVAVMGDSAGGGLAACLALKARDESLSPPLAKQILIYPMLDDTTTRPIAALEPFLTWTYDDNVTGWQAYLGEKSNGQVSQYAAAARASDLAGLPPTYIDLGELDIFRDENLAYASRLAQVNTCLELHVYPGVPHAFETFASQTSIAKQAMANRMRAMLSF